MIGLNFLYLLALQSMISLRAQDTRFVPFVLMTWMIQPVVNSLIGVLALGGETRRPIDAEYPNFYTRVDGWFYLSIALAAILCWILFDQKRSAFINQFPNLSETGLFRYRLLILSSQFVFSIGLSYVGHINPWYSLITFATVVFISSVLVSRFFRGRLKGGGQG